MKIFLQNKQLELFSGAHVRDAVRAYSPAILDEIHEGKKCVVDHHGNDVSLDGALTPNEALKIRDNIRRETGNKA